MTSIDELIIQNDNAERLLRQYAPYYHALEGECPSFNSRSREGATTIV